MVIAVINYLTSIKRSVTIKHFEWKRVSFHTPVIHSCFCHQSDCVHVDPLPKDHIFVQCVGLHLGLHLNVENLKSSHCCQSTQYLILNLIRLLITFIATFKCNDFSGRIHDGRVCRNGSADGGLRVGHIDDNHLCRFSNLLSNAYKFVAFHRERIEADVRRIDSDGSQLQSKSITFTFISFSFHTFLSHKNTFNLYKNTPLFM